MKQALTRALNDNVNGYGDKHIQIDDDAVSHFVQSAAGDIRTALNALELAILSAQDDPVHITLQDAKDCLQKPSFNFDSDGDMHYDIMSAFQKSIRGSDVDASLHYLARLIEGGDLHTITRRLLVISYEDVGLASPGAGARTLAAIESAERLGFPKLAFHLRKL